MLLWIPGQPDSVTDQNSLAMDTNEGGRWRDLPDDDTHGGFICRIGTIFHLISMHNKQNKKNPLSEKIVFHPPKVLCQAIAPV